MTKTAASPALKLRGPTGLVAAVPSLLGFHPQESLVVLCIRPPGLVGPVVRADLDGSGQPPPAAMAAQLASFAIRYGQTAAVICYTEQGGRPPLLDETIAALDRGDMPIFVVLTVRDGVIRSSWTAEIEAADHGLPEPPDDDPQAQAMAVLNVGSGRGVLRNRDALRASIAAPVGDALTEARAAILGFCEELSSLPADVPQIEATMVARGSRAMTRARRELRQAGRVATGTAAELIVLTNSVAVRDAVIARAVAQYDTDWVATFISVVTRCPPEEAAEICSVLAVVAYRYGDGALSQVAIDRCLAAEPRHRLGHLLLSATGAGLPPEELAELAGADPAARRRPRRARGRRAAG